MTYLSFQSVAKVFAGRTGNLEVVAPFDFSVARGEFIVFLGPSGCGKTTLMRMAGGLETPSSGTIQLDGAVLDKPDRRRGMVFQSYSSFPWMTVEENIAFGMRYRSDLSAAEKRERTAHYLAVVGLADFAASYPSRISGGMRQRVAIARTLAAGSDVLLMDEPFGALDAQRREKLQTTIRELLHAEKKTIIFVTHDVEEAIFLADRTVLFTKRPARIEQVFDVASRFGETRDLALRDAPEFLAMRKTVLDLVRMSAEENLP
jgi:NitT/TauT family transport system ATP-binding protein